MQITTAKEKTQQQKRKHNGKSENTTTKEKTQRQKRKHNKLLNTKTKHNIKTENTTTLTKPEKVGTLRRHESSLIGRRKGPSFEPERRGSFTAVKPAVSRFGLVEPAAPTFYVHPYCDFTVTAQRRLKQET